MQLSKVPSDVYIFNTLDADQVADHDRPPLTCACMGPTRNFVCAVKMLKICKHMHMQYAVQATYFRLVPE